jgi:hypothetical protein
MSESERLRFVAQNIELFKSKSLCHEGMVWWSQNLISCCFTVKKMYL